MGHSVNAKEMIYHALAERLSKAPEGAKINGEFMALLHNLYLDGEAKVASKFPMVPMTLDKIAALTDMEEDKLEDMLKDMSYRGLVIDIPRRGEVYYMLTPFVIGFFEYTFMRTGEAVEMKELAELFEKYFNSEGLYETIAGKDTKIMRTLVYENVMPLAVETEVLDYERAMEIIRQSGGGSISTCSCRHQASHLGTACDAPQEVCISLGRAAKWLISKNLARPATVGELLEVLEETQKLGLVHLCDNVMDNPTYICSCCSCCCHLLRGVNEKNIMAFHPSNFIADLEREKCVNCGLCVTKCPVDAIKMTLVEDVEIPVVNEDLCIGCGVCAHFCPTDAMVMFQRSELHIPPKDIKEKLKRLAVENKRM
ncbi:4Fe-4S dicluster domain-containing protein [Dethiosulfatibacter aminovorans DSM 17477]|uniref:4Fe-4S dicluster domain-containing protein n=1 Tax=Dethiosulfatibacter aminovorans DSM 17477 TaxID=1121476 RepID=A0A1M6EJI7_9FIRM|nr:4Fe-4S binding protein [Dethiosulfatibacter aminovorans]SHI85647.1 4Fe-4S dicluster domain-containing protein [Dethiosulfatibacter aminovorans DSM 17477]